MKGSTVPPLAACIAPPEAAAMMSSWASVMSLAGPARPTGGMIVSMSVSSERAAQPRASRRAFRREARMNHGAVAGERRRLHDLVVPLDRQRLLFLVHQDLEKGEQVLGVEARRRGGDAARDVEVADDLDTVGGDDLAALGAFDIAAALDREIDDHGARPHRGHHILRDQPRRWPA